MKIKIPKKLCYTCSKWHQVLNDDIVVASWNLFHNAYYGWVETYDIIIMAVIFVMTLLASLKGELPC